MIVFKYIFWVFYRIWFYILVALPIIVLFPILLFSISREKWYPFFFRLARFWAKFILIGMGFIWKVESEQKPEKGKSYMFIANHTSMVDIMLMLGCCQEIHLCLLGKRSWVKFHCLDFSINALYFGRQK